MKKISFRLILAALAATVALAGCTKEISSEEAIVVPASQSTAGEGSRVIAVSFAPQTKTTFSETPGGIAPYFVKGDKICLCSDIDNPTDDNTQICEVDVDDETDVATITTKLTGELTAYYPASFVTESSKHGLFIYVPSVQDGTFAKANICSATITENATSANFENMYALLTITPPAGTKKLTIKSLRPIGDDGQRSDPKRNHICGTGDDLYKITVGDGTNAIPSPCYVAMIGGNVNLSDLSFEAPSDEEGTTGYIKGITTSAIAAKAGTGVAVGSEAYNTCNTVAEGTAYTIDSDNWHEYVTIAGRKWATANVKTYENYDDYFMWGTTVLAYESMQDDMVVMKEDNPYGEDYKLTWTPTSYFSWKNYPFTADVFSETNKNVFTKYVPSGAVDYGYGGFSDNKLCLDLWNDAAYANWGGAWRMPTIEELEARGYDSLPCNGVMMYEGSNEPNNLGGMGYYWSSSLDSINPSNAKCLYFDDSGFNHAVQSQPRFWGCSIRAIIDDPDAVTPPTPEEQENLLLPGRFTVGSDKEVYFTKGNLYWDGSKWAVEENQYDFSPHSSGYVSNHVSLLFWTKDANNSYVSTYSETDLTGVDHLFCDGSDANHFLTIGGNTGLYALSSGEWEYLLNTRTDASTLYSSVSITVNDGPISCLAIAPDKCIGEYSFDSSKTTYTLEEYTTATTAGVLFLPVAGYRSNDSYESDNKSDKGYYWAATPQGQYGKLFDTADTLFEGSCAMGRSNGCSIRLVKKVPQAQK